MNTCVKGSRLRRAEELFLIFLLTSFAGWLYEVFLEVVVYRWGYSDRGVLTGPYCPVYGVGAVVLLLCLYPFKKRKIAIGLLPVTPILVFVGIVAIATAVELAVSYITEWITGGRMWDYTRFSFNFQGRIALNPSLRFGVGGMAFLYLLYPLLRRLLAKCSGRAVSAVTAICGIIFSADCLWFLLKHTILR